jgi:hypothetical protein
MKSTETLLRDPLEDAFFSSVEARLVGQGWISSVDVPYRVAPIEGRYLRPSDGLVVPVTQLSYYGRGKRHRYVEAEVGVTCPSAERVLWAMGAECNVTVGEHAGILSRGTELVLQLNRDADLEPAVTQAARVVQEEWHVVARNIPDADAIIDRLRAFGDEFDSDGAQIPVILAAAGRIPEARESIRSYRRAYADADFDVFADDFEAWLDEGAVIPVPSAEAFPAPKPHIAHGVRYARSEVAAAAVVGTYAGLRHLFGRRSKQASDD